MTRKIQEYIFLASVCNRRGYHKHMKSGKHFDLEQSTKLLLSYTAALRLLTATISHSYHSPIDKNILESCKSGDFKLFPLFLLVSQILQFCLEVTKNKKFILPTFVLWRIFGNTNPLLELLFL